MRRRNRPEQATLHREAMRAVATETADMLDTWLADARSVPEPIVRAGEDEQIAAAIALLRRVGERP